MANILLNPLLAKAKGKLSGTAFRTNRTGQQILVRITTTKTATRKQRLQRASFSAIVHAWDTQLSQAQRIAWVEFAATLTSISKLGTPKAVSALAAFQSVNLNRAAIGLPPLLDAPLNHTITDIHGINLVQPLSPPRHITIATTSLTEPYDYLVVEAAPPQPLGVTKLSYKAFRHIMHPGPNPGQPIDLTAAYTAVFKSPPPNKVLPFTVWPVNSTNGAKGPAYTSAIVLT